MAAQDTKDSLDVLQDMFNEAVSTSEGYSCARSSC